MPFSRKDYYKAEVLRVIAYPLVFFIVICLLLQLKLYDDDSAGLSVYWNIALATLVSCLLCYGLSYVLVKPKKRRRRRKR